MQWREPERPFLVDVRSTLDQLSHCIESAKHRRIQQWSVSVLVQLIRINTVFGPRLHRQLIATLGLLGQRTLGLGVIAEEEPLQCFLWTVHVRV